MGVDDNAVFSAPEKRLRKKSCTHAYAALLALLHQAVFLAICSYESFAAKCCSAKNYNLLTTQLFARSRHLAFAGLGLAH